MRIYFLGVIITLGLLAGCIPTIPADQISVKTEPTVTHAWVPLQVNERCSNQFVSHDLPHITASVVERVPYFISNGAGLAINDLDNDGDLDFVLGNILGPNQIFWNEGQRQFRPETLFEGSTRAITIVDIEGDGWQDIVVTSRTSNVRIWRNTGTDTTSSVTRFVEGAIPGVRALAYAINWADWDTDGDLDLVTASYDAALEKQLGQNFRDSNLNGVFLYENQVERFNQQARLANQAQALAVEVLDLNQDHRPDILVGNDFDQPDYAWYNLTNGWQPTAPFSETTLSTMSFTSDDLNNDGQSELFAADMHPYSTDSAMMQQWQPILDTMVHNLAPDDPQTMANVLQTPDEQGQFYNTAPENGVAATGWSWSAKFGDLDQDGHLDLYVVNGMTSMEIFNHLPNDELIEENQAYKNQGQGQFVPAPEWHLNSTYSGRSMSMADLDDDGDLDIIVNNLRQPAQLFENQLCQGASLQVDLRWPTSKNRVAIGAKITLHTSTGSYTRQVRATSGYLSGDPARLHFGFPENSELQRLEIQWPDGITTQLSALKAGHLLSVNRN